MDKREERSRSKRVILGVVLATVVLASVSVAMLGSIGASSTGGPYNIIEKDTVNTVLIGQDLEFSNTDWSAPPVVYRYVSGDLENTYQATESGGKYYFYTVNWPTTGAFYVNGDSASNEALLSVEDPKMPLKLKVKDKEVTTIARSTNLNIDVGGINLFDEDKVDLVIIGPNGQITEKNGQMFTDITVAALKNLNDGGAIDTTGWDIGHYTFQVKTKPDNACGLDDQSVKRELTIVRGDVTIKADTTEVPELTVVRLTVTGVAGHTITVQSDPLSKNAYFPAGLDDNPMGVTTQWFNDTIDDDRTRHYAVAFNDIGIYTIRVTDCDEVDSYDTVDISVTDKEVVFYVPATIAIGERVTIKGTANTGQTVTIAVEDEIVQKLYQIIIDENGEFYEEIDTSSCDAPSSFMVPGIVSLKAYIDYQKPADQSLPSGMSRSEKDDGSTEVFMVRGWLAGSLSDDTVEPGDDFTISGTANGSRSVNILIIAPRGFSGSNIEGGIYMYYSTTSVRTSDNGFYKKISVGNNVDTGRYLVAVLSPGSDGLWGMYGYPKLYDPDDINDPDSALGQYTLRTRTQTEMLEILGDTMALSDDLIWVNYVTVGEQETLTLNPIADVVTGDSLIVTGESNMKEGSVIWLTVKGHYFEIVPQAAYVSDNTFNATFDTAGAPPGIYTVQALDGYSRTATTKVLIYTEGVVPTSFDTGAGSYPSITGTHNGTITIQRRQWW